MMKIKSIIINTGNKIFLHNIDEDYLAAFPKLKGSISEKCIIHQIFSSIDGNVRSCELENIQYFRIVEFPGLMFYKENIDIPKTFEETNYKEKYNELLDTLQQITECESPKDMYDLALEALENKK